MSSIHLDRYGPFLLATKQTGFGHTFGASVSETETTATANVEGVLCILAMSGWNHKAVLVVSDGHVEIHILDLGDAESDLFEYLCIHPAINVLVALEHAHREHAFKCSHYWLNLAGCQQVGQVLDRNAKLAH